MKTQKLNLIIIGLIINPFILIAQLPEWNDEMTKPNANYYEIRDEVKSVFEIDSTARNSIGGIKSFNRWNWFWQNRVGKNQEGKTGSFLYASEAILNLINNPFCTGLSGISS